MSAGYGVDSAGIIRAAWMRDAPGVHDATTASGLTVKIPTDQTDVEIYHVLWVWNGTAGKAEPPVLARPVADSVALAALKAGYRVMHGATANWQDGLTAAGAYRDQAEVTKGHNFLAWNYMFGYVMAVDNPAGYTIEQITAWANMVPFGSAQVRTVDQFFERGLQYTAPTVPATFINPVGAVRLELNALVTLPAAHTFVYPTGVNLSRTDWIDALTGVWTADDA